MPSHKISKASGKRRELRKVLILGSGALKIGEAGEFDYSGSQAIKALKEERIFTVLINPNIATNQTSKGLADKVYFLPVNAEFSEQVIEKERPDGILLSFGGQTALNCGVELFEKGILKKYKVEVLGTPVEAIQKTEDREIFNNEMKALGLKVPKSVACKSVESGMAAAEKIGFPVIVRAAFALGGKGSGFAFNEKELHELLETAFAYSPQVLVEENLKGWKEVEYEVVRDRFNNCVTVCNMENFDPLGIHTGESIVVAPSQTLTNREYHQLRERAIKVIQSLGIIGECNIQYALDPLSEDYRIIEVNARLSRSSALASKATGYPLAHIAAKLALGYSLPELRNAVTKTTTACFEPALDYLALKIPRWDLDKFRKVSQEISSEMKSVGEIMALGRSFEEVIQKGLRMLQIGLYGFVTNENLADKPKDLAREIQVPTPRRILAVAEALRQGWSLQKISKLSGIDEWFLGKLENIVKLEKVLKKAKTVDRELMLQAKRYGFSDKQISILIGKKESMVRAMRKKMGIVPYVKQIDTLAAEYPAKTNYLYLTYHGDEHDVDYRKSKRKKMVVLGGGPYAIGTSVEFDWCCVNALKTCGKAGYEKIIINYNPETVSTDYDMSDKLYFDELSLERVLDICELENPAAVVVSMGGQVPNNLSLKLADVGIKLLGTEAKNIDRAESRHKFSALCDRLGIDQPRWQEMSTVDEVKKFTKEVGYPVLVRPSYVLSGAAMAVAHTDEALTRFLGKATRISTEAPVVVSKFEQGAKEIEIDAVAMKGDVIIYAIAEHIENAGVHSGDATIVLPPQKLYIETIRRIKTIAKQIAKELEITGPFNIQFLAKNNDVKVIECNLRASRSFPFSSKVTGYNFIEIAMEAMLGMKSLKEFRANRYQTLDLDHVGVKAPQFSFSRLKGADPVSGVEMASTGEVACFGDDMYEAFFKAMISVGFKIPNKNVLLSIGRMEDKVEFLPSARVFQDMGFKIYATEGTSAFLRENGIDNTLLYKASTNFKPNFIDAITEKKVDLVVNIPKSYTHEEVTDGYLIRRKAIDYNISLVTNLQVAELIVAALARGAQYRLSIKEWAEYE
ncbi:carbamoyl-phosphate synthase (glutamine-hydrolyzing) large subunit [Patescibacteria group bacterium]|nr:carbamoyl-phosphate synthase (glutamine-hydrolyzing) large subunit [Patescibacteria group bacterium]MBU1703233.1 carbamoyl-phosphate synthase (glutamine-hydrolyzing) large subunit [Patescibacteria group bacterium]MBU1953839.1 carbamoyl-phosphate synthase (glutamine-hydrolyzing) large subunit [Patescibacteria group bacterium]